MLSFLFRCLSLVFLANFYVPQPGDVFDDVMFTEIYGPAAEKIVKQYKDDASGAPYPPSSKRPRYGDHYSSGGSGGGSHGSSGGGR